MSVSWFRREFLVGRRLAFNVIFYGLHVAFFAYGWWSQVGTPSRTSPSFTYSFIGDQYKAGWSQLPQVVGLDISWRWPRPGF